jgi:hypothetical protein
MIKYLVLSVIGYYIFTYYISPMLEGTQHSGRNQKTEKHNQDNHDDEYVDYEEVD